MAVLISIGTGSTGQDGRGESTSSAHAHTHTVSVRAIRKERNAGSLTVRHLRRLAALGDSRAVSYARVFRLAPRRHYLRPSLRQPLPQARVFGCGSPVVASQCASHPFPPVRSGPHGLASSRLVSSTMNGRVGDRCGVLSGGTCLTLPRVRATHIAADVSCVGARTARLSTLHWPAVCYRK